MKRLKNPLVRLRWRTRALLNIVCIAAAALLIYAGRGFPYLSEEQDIKYTLRRNLAENAEIFYSQRIPEGLGRFSGEAEETVYLVRWEETVGAMSMHREHAGNTWYGGMNRDLVEYENRDGLYIIPLYGAFPDEDGMFEGITVAVVTQNSAVDTVEVTWCENSEAEIIVVDAEPVQPGLFVVQFDVPGRDIQYDVYDDLLAHNYLGAIAYDKNGAVLSRAWSVWEEHQNENR